MAEIKHINPDYLFEVSWEVCNKVGGIHTVISTKALSIHKELNDNYILIGPDVWKETHQNPEFTEDNYLFRRWREQAAKEGLRLKIGRWNIASNPIVILVDFTHYFVNKDEIFKEYWEKYKLDSIAGAWDYIEPAMFGYAAAKAIESFYEYNLTASDKIVAQFHEWMTGTGVLYLKDRVPQVGLIFTTHATVAGRTIAGNNLHLYRDLNQYNADLIAKNYNTTAKHSLEKLSAQACDCFTTVSEITAKECAQFLHRNPDVITPNGFEAAFVPEESDFEHKRKSARQLLEKVTSAFLNQKIDDNTIFLINSGRYEFRNKGIELFIDALGEINRNGNAGKQIVAYLTVPANNKGPKQELIDRMENTDFTNPITDFYLTHWLEGSENDPIIRRLKENKLRNLPEDKVKVIFVPCYLNGIDGIFNLNYYELLIGFDLSVFPSYYEPWGYTPLESLAFHIPTITTTLAGFGLWIRQKYGDIKNGVIIIERDDNGNEKVIKDISTFIEKFTNKTQEEIKHCREKAYYISRTALWENLIINYKDAYSFALYKVESRSPLFINKRQKEHIEDIIHTEQTQPDWKKVYIYTEIPKSLAKLEELASNLWWCWNYEAEELFSSIDPKIWDKINNPVALLKQLTLEQLKDLENNKDFINNLDKVYSKFERYMNRKAPKNEINIAYFSMEFGLHTSLKIYSGGLGVLAGDYLKEASDQNKNIVAVGLLYRQGYFEQSISLIGDQISEFISQKFSQLPLKPVRDENNNWIKISLAFPGRAMFAKAWQIDVGKIKLYLLDTDLEENLPSDRQVTYQLYGGDLENRFKQEVLLGVGGIRLLKEVGFTPDLYHCNEGHAAFTAIERLRSFIQEEHFTFKEAVEIIKSSSLFTTHTPVPAGHDAFPEDLLRAYVPHYAERLNIKWNTFMNLGKFNENDPKEKFSLSVLASKLSQEINAVSRLHCKVTKEMFNPIWKAFYPDELFIDYVTNGVHYQTWTNKKLQKLYKKEFDKEFLSDCSDGRHWKKIYQVTDKELWEVRKALKKDLIEFVKLKINNDFTKRNENPKLIFNTIDGLSDKALTIGFARRFATYKRAHLLFHNLEHLDQIVNNKERPVQFIFAGKAHPADKAGQDYIKRIIEVSKMEKFQGKIVFLENYDMTIARKMIEGVDLWLNTPTRLKEASGTSGMKALMNGVVNFSVMDGWWSEGYIPGAGWQIKEEGTYENDEFQNELDAELIYNLLEDEIVPAYYEREDDIPYKWLSIVKKSIAEVAPVFTTTRMINEYYEKFYNKLYLRINEIKENNYKNVKTIANWKKKILRGWDSIEVVSLTMPDSTNKPLKLGEYFVAELVLKLNELSPEDISVEIIFGQKEKEKVEKILFIEEMSIAEISQKNVKFVCKTEAVHSGVFDYAFRVIPKNSLMAHKQDFNLVKWI